MDWRDSNIVLGEQMNTRGYDSSTLLPSHKGVGILRPDGETDAGTDVLAMTVHTYYMPNPQWRKVCARGRALREAAGTLAGHAVGDDQRQAIDPASVVKVLGAGAPVATEGWNPERSAELPEPLASVVDYLDDDLRPRGREFVPTAELTDELDVEPGLFARQMGEMGCRPTRQYVPTEDGGARRVRGYLTADIRAAIDRATTDKLAPTKEPIPTDSPVGRFTYSTAARGGPAKTHRKAESPPTSLVVPEERKNI
jgi:DNA segregation ATPase FtsK/SpoIIIE, S-DNA-T family